MAKFKVGDQVRYNGSGTSDGTLSDGEIGKITKIEGELWPYYIENAAGEVEPFDEGQLEIAGSPWDSLKVGDILIDNDGDKRRVFGVVGEAVFVEHATEPGRWSHVFSVGAMQKQGWKIKGAKTTAVTELTVAELEEKLGLEAGTLRVKKG